MKNNFFTYTRSISLCTLIIIGCLGCNGNSGQKDRIDTGRELLLCNKLALDAYDFIKSGAREDPVVLSDLISLLGFPEKCIYTMLLRNSYGDIDVANTRLGLAYDDGKVLVEANVLGEPFDVLLENDDGTHSGPSLPPRLFDTNRGIDLQEVNARKKISDNLIAKIRTLFGSRRNAEWWNELLERYRYHTIINQVDILAPLDHDIVKVDFPANDIAMIVFRIVDDSNIEYFIDTWWHLAGDDWTEVSIKEICELLEAKNRESEYDSIGAHKLGYGVLIPSLVDNNAESLNKDASISAIHAQRMEIDECSSMIMAKLGTTFGVRYRITNLPPSSQIVLSKNVQHPPMKRPGGSAIKGYKYFEMHTTSPDGTLNTWTGFKFDQEYETVPGAWTMIMRYRGEELFRQTFTVVKD